MVRTVSRLGEFHAGGQATDTPLTEKFAMRYAQTPPRNQARKSKPQEANNE